MSLQVSALASGDRAAVISPRCRVTRPNTRSIPDCVDLRFQPNNLQHSPSIAMKVLWKITWRRRTGKTDIPPSHEARYLAPIWMSGIFIAKYAKHGLYRDLGTIRWSIPALTLSSYQSHHSGCEVQKSMPDRVLLASSIYLASRSLCRFVHHLCPGCHHRACARPGYEERGQTLRLSRYSSYSGTAKCRILQQPTMTGSTRDR